MTAPTDLSEVAPSAWRVLEAWEYALSQPRPVRALTLLTMLGAAPDFDATGLSDVSVGARDRRLLKVRTALFGPELAGVEQCPDCDETVDISATAGELLSLREGIPAPVKWHGSRHEVRLPTTADVSAVTGFPMPDARRRLAARCLATNDASVGGRSVPLDPDELEDDLVDLIEAHLAAADPSADIAFAVQCPHCSQRWTTAFDIGDFFLAEISSWVPSMLLDVQIIAGAYGWSEQEILRLPAWRREYYATAAAR